MERTKEKVLKKYLYLLPPFLLCLIFVFFQLPRLNSPVKKPEYPFKDLHSSFNDQFMAKVQGLYLRRLGYSKIETVREALQIRQSQLVDTDILDFTDIKGKLISKRAQIKHWSPSFVLVDLDGQLTKVNANQLSMKSQKPLMFKSDLIIAYEKFSPVLEKEFKEAFEQHSYQYKDYNFK